MRPEDWRRYIVWWGFSVILPLIVYAALLIICWMRGQPDAFVTILAKGDLLFLAIVLLTLATNWAAEDLLYTPRNRASLQVVSRHGLAALCRVLLNSNEFLYY